MRISLPLEVTRAARGLAKNLEKEKPRHPYIELAVNFKAFCLMSYCILQERQNIDALFLQILLPVTSSLQIPLIMGEVWVFKQSFD